MMPDRVIVIFPNFADAGPLQQLRTRFDPLAELVPPHITLVFPFENDQSTDDLRRHLKQVTAGISPFAIRLQGVTGADGEYLFLNVKRGNDELIALHDRLYTGPLMEHLRRDLTFVPHLTVGRLNSSAAFQAALNSTGELVTEFNAIVSELSVYTIYPDGARVTEVTVSLTG